MIVIAIIGIISSVLGFNMRGSLDKAKAFKTVETIKKVYEVFHLESEGISVTDIKDDQVKSKVEDAIKRSFPSKTQKYLVDGWNKPLEIRKSKKGDDIRIISEHYQEFCLKRGQPTEYPWEDYETEDN